MDAARKLANTSNLGQAGLVTAFLKEANVIPQETFPAGTPFAPTSSSHSTGVSGRPPFASSVAVSHPSPGLVWDYQPHPNTRPIEAAIARMDESIASSNMKIRRSEYQERWQNMKRSADKEAGGPRGSE